MSDYVFILVSAGTPQMQSKPCDGRGSPPEYIRQSLGWCNDNDGFAVRLFKMRRGKHLFRDTQEEVLVYDEVVPNPTLCYRALDYSYFCKQEWQTPTQRNLSAVFEELYDSESNNSSS